MDIDRCYCYQKTFRKLKEIAEATGAESVCELQEHTTFGENCQLCHPYVERMLDTGCTSFDEIIESEESRCRTGRGEGQ